MERILIEKLGTRQKDRGYNIKEGGNSSKLTEEIKQKISKSHMRELNPMYGRKYTDEEIENLRKRMSGSNNPRYGKKCSEETRRKISESLKGRHPSEEARRHQSEAQKGLMKGRKRPDGSGKPPKKIICVETGEVFDSIAEAARQKGIKSKTNISKCAKGEAKTVGGFHWQYYELLIS